MDPITLAMLGSTAISGISSIMGGNEASKANQANADIAMLNYYAQQSAQRRQIAESQRQQGEAHMGSTDASGNRTYFVPGVGWVTDLSDKQQELQRGTEEEQLRQVNQGADRAEQVDARAVEDRNAEDTIAQAAMDELRGVRQGDRNSLRQQFIAQGQQGRNRQADAIGGQVARQAIRAGGGGNAAELLAAGRGIADQEAAQQANIDATLRADEAVTKDFDHSRDRASNLYDYFRRASTSGTTAAPTGYTPTGPQRSSTGVADQGIINAMGAAPQREYQSPNLAWTDTANDIAKLAGGFAQYKQNDKMMDYYKQRYAGNTGVMA